MNVKFAGVFLLSTVLGACGGSGSNSGSRDPNAPVNCPQLTSATSTGVLTPTIENQKVQIFGDLQNEAGGAGGFALLPMGSLVVDTINWEQTNGPTLNFLADNSQTIGFDIPESGNYTLRVSVQMKGEATPTAYNIDFSATSGQQKASVRVDHTVTELGKVSLHLGVPEGKEIKDVQWSQIGGPQVQNEITDEAFLFFDAPSVASDSVIAYRANVIYQDDSTDTDDVLVTVKNADFDENGLFCGNGIIISQDMFAYRDNNPYKNALERCVYNNTIPNPPVCTFSELPLIGMQTNSPSINDVLNRTLVSHQWMGDRFADYLQNSAAGPDMLNLLRGVTAVIISYDVRPSFYWSATGAIYLDANNFWQTPSERDTLNDQPDYRSDFGSDLNFSIFWRYTKDNDYYPQASTDKQDRIARDFSDFEASISWLMYHELAHANDFFPSTSWSAISPSSTPLAYFRANGASSDILNNNFPLRSDEMHSLAQVRFSDATPTTAEKNYRGTDIEGFFTPDISPSFYSYLTDREDFATLVERYLMLYRLDAEADIAIIDGETLSEEPLVVWGQRNRITEASLEDRTVFAVTKVYPELDDVRTTLRNLSSPVLMVPNDGWFENIDISPSNSVTNSLQLDNKKVLKKYFPKKLQKQLIQADTRDIHLGKPSGK